LQNRKIFIFSIKGRLLGQITEIGGNFLRNPRDIALFYLEEGRYRFYLIDGDVIKIAEIYYQSRG
jgi:hypothetical protein